MGVIVVGVDGSDHSVEALRFAAREARIRHATLRVIMGWLPPPEDSYFGSPAADYAALEASARRIVESMVTAMSADLADIEVESIVDVGEAAAILAHCSDAELVVVGSRGRGGFKGLLLGSVSQHVVNHAPCPVVVVRQHADDTQPT